MNSRPVSLVLRPLLACCLFLLSTSVARAQGTPGPCCVGGSTCVITTAARCQSLGGTYQGDGMHCATTCSRLPRGACCQPSGTCLVVWQQRCHVVGGVYQGDGTACTGTDCTTTIGACLPFVPPMPLGGD